MQTAHDVVIENNSFSCRFDNTCLFIGSAGIPDYSNPAEVPGNVRIAQNTITNYKADNGGDWVSINGGNGIVFENNVITSAVTLNDVYLTMINIANGEAIFRNNSITTPVKLAPGNSATVALNMRTQEYQTTGVYEHNTIIHNNGNTPGANQNSCFTLFDSGGHPNIAMNVTFQYNLCHHDGTTVHGDGMQLIYSLGSTNLSLTDSFNGFSNIEEPITDNTGTYTTTNSNSVLRPALFKRENISVIDDLELNPISAHLDVNGTLDIGASSGVRSTTMLLDDDCVIDYVTCHGQTSDLMAKALKNGDTVELAPGTYAPFTLSNFENLPSAVRVRQRSSMQQGGSNGFQINSVHESTIEDVRVINVTTNTEDYLLTMDTLSTAMADYNTFGVVLFMDAGCASTPITPNVQRTSMPLLVLGSKT